MTCPSYVCKYVMIGCFEGGEGVHLVTILNLAIPASCLHGQKAILTNFERPIRTGRCFLPVEYVCSRLSAGSLRVQTSDACQIQLSVLRYIMMHVGVLLHLLVFCS